MQTSSPFSFQKPNYGTEEGYLLEDTNLIQKENKKNPPVWHLFILRVQSHYKLNTTIENVRELFTVANVQTKTRRISTK